MNKDSDKSPADRSALVAVIALAVGSVVFLAPTLFLLHAVARGHVTDWPNWIKIVLVVALGTGLWIATGALTCWVAERLGIDASRNSSGRLYNVLSGLQTGVMLLIGFGPLMKLQIPLWGMLAAVTATSGLCLWETARQDARKQRAASESAKAPSPTQP